MSPSGRGEKTLAASLSHSTTNLRFHSLSITMIFSWAHGQDNDIKSFTFILVLTLWKPQNHSTPALDATGECLDKTFRQLKARILRSWSWRLEKFLGGHILAQELGQPARCSGDKRKTNRKSKSPEHLIMEAQTHVKVSLYSWGMNLKREWYRSSQSWSIKV